MPIHFSYKQHFLEHILKNSKSLFPGATSVIAVFYSKQNHGLNIISKELEQQNNLTAEKELDVHAFEDFRRQRPRYSWINQQNSPNSSIEKQLKIQGEFKHHSLLIRFANTLDGLNDIVLINFKNEDQIFRISDKKQKLSTDLKQSIASVYVRTLDVIRNQIESDASIHSVIQEHRGSIDQMESNHASDIRKLKNNQLQLIEEIVDKETTGFLKDNEYSIEWDKEALSFIADNFTSLTQIEGLIKNALIIAINDNNSQSHKLRVQKSHIKTIQPIKEKESTQLIDTKYQRTISLLDRYEEAATDVLKEKLNLTGNNLANNLNPPISAAAISDAIRKHATKITYLLNTYPNRWSILRTNFRPIQNKLFSPIQTNQIAS